AAQVSGWCAFVGLGDEKQGRRSNSPARATTWDMCTARRVIRTSVSSYSMCRWSESPGVFARDSGGSGADQTATVKHARAIVIKDKIKRRRIAAYLPQ